MQTHRKSLPQLGNSLFLTDGGTETYLMYKKGLELPHFSAFHLLKDSETRQIIKEYYQDCAQVAKDYGVGFIYDSLTYRASRDWGALLGYSTSELEKANHDSIMIYREVAEEIGDYGVPIIYSGCLGPRGDAYQLNQEITADSAEEYHREQIQILFDTGVDIITALTLNSVYEAIGIVRASADIGIPAVISFTLEKGGKLSSGQTLLEAIMTVDQACSEPPAYYMINCSHPLDYEPVLEDAPWMLRIRGLRSNASSLDHGTLCQLGHLDEGNPNELAQQISSIIQRFPHITVVGGCCGTDNAHIRKMCKLLLGK